MFRKINPIVLFVILAVLLVAAIVLLRMDARRQQGSFLRELVHADAEKTTSIVIIPKGVTDDAITIEKSDEIWMVGSHGKMRPANSDNINRIFQMISPLVPEQLVSRGKDNWDEYEISDEKGTRVKIFQGKRLSSEFIFGKMDFQSQMIQGQQRPKINTFVRLEGKDEVYTVEGFLGSAFPAGAENYRNQTVVNVKEADIDKIMIEGTDQNYTLSREGMNWLINNIPSDSANTVNFIRKLTTLRSTGFVEDESEGRLTMSSYKMIIERKSEDAIEILAYPADITHNYFITSSQNPGSVFSGSQNNLFESLFHPTEYFLSSGSIRQE